MKREGKQPIYEKREGTPVPEVIVEDIPELRMAMGYISNGDAKEIIDQEAFEIASLAFHRSDARNEIVEQLRRNKPHVGDPEQYIEKVFSILENISQVSVAPDSSWEKRAEILRPRVEALLSYFNPSSDWYHIRKVVALPVDDFVNVQGGRSFQRGSDWIVASHSQNPDNFDHEFLHSFMNQIVDHLASAIGQEKITQLVTMASGKLKEDYGEECPHSIFTEELIRTYNDYVKQKRNPQNVPQQFMEKIDTITQKQFQDALNDDERFVQNLKKLNINNFNEFKERAKEYFDKYEKDELRDILFDLYKNYEETRKRGDIEDFESFLIQNIVNN